MKPKPVEITIQALTDAPHAALRKMLKKLSHLIATPDGRLYLFEIKQIQCNTIRESETRTRR